MPICEKCGKQCDNLYKGKPLLNIIMSGSNPNTPQGRGYYKLCKTCKNKEEKNEYSLVNAVSYFLFKGIWKGIKYIYPIAGFLFPAVIGYYFGIVWSIILGIIGIGAFIVLQKKKPAITKFASIIIIVVTLLLVILIYKLL